MMHVSHYWVDEKIEGGDTGINRAIREKFDYFEMSPFRFGLRPENLIAPIKEEVEAYCKVKFALEGFRTSCET